MSNSEEAKAVIQAEKIERSERALNRIQAVLDEERCSINPIMVLAQGNVVGRIEVIAAD